MAHGRGSKQEELFKELRRFAEQSGFEVRCEKLLREVGYRVRSGSCSVNGKRWIILDSSLSPRDRIELLADEIRDAIPESAELPPNLQKYLTRQSRAARPTSNV